MDKLVNPGPVVEILRGKTAYPQRPIVGDRFLIGAGGNCHLQLGAQDVPMLHSVIVLSNGTARIEAFSSHPPLLVNDRQCREAELRTGDIIRVGRIDFTVRGLEKLAAEFASQQKPAASTASEPAPVPATLKFTPEALAALTIDELCDRIEAEQVEVHTLEDNRKFGAAALLEAARRSAFTPAPAGESPASADETLAETLAVRPGEQDRAAVLLAELRQLSSDLAEREKLLCERERACEERGRQLAEAQEKLALQLAHVLAALDRQAAPALRASA